MAGADRYDKLADAVSDILLLVDADGVVLYVNPAGALLLGISREEIEGRSIFEPVHPDDLPYARDNFAAMAEGTAPPGTIRLRVITAYGDWRTLEMMGANKLDDDELRGIVISCRDITDQIRPANVAAFDADRLRRLIDASGDLVLLLGRDDAIEFVNATVQPMLGYDPADVLGKPWLDLVLPEDLERLSNDRTEVRATPGATMHAEIRLRRSDGGATPVEVHVTNERDNPFIEGMVVTARDVTLLRHAQARLTSALATAQVGVLELDTNGRILTANHVLSTLMDADEQDLGGRELASCFHEDDQTAIRAAVEWLAGGHETATGVEGRWQSSIDAAPRWVLCNLSAAHDEDGAMRDLTCFLTDITRRKEQEANLRQLNEELARYATHDALTDLANRFLFNDHLDRALGRAKRTGGQVAVLFCDLDWFKEVNDTHGHAAGDEVLVITADRLRSNLRPSDVLARFGGDEFAVLADDLPSTTEVIALANRLVQAMAEPVPVAGTTVQLGLSVGIAFSTPESTPTTLLQEADQAVYEAKARGRGRYAFAAEQVRQAAAPEAPSSRPFG